MSANAQQLAEALKMAIVVKHVHTRMLRGNRDSQVGERQTVSAMRAKVGEFPHRR